MELLGCNKSSAARMATQNRFKTGLDIAKYTAIMEKDMADYDANALHTITRFLAWFCNKI
jgi:isocitrate lyase